MTCRQVWTSTGSFHCSETSTPVNPATTSGTEVSSFLKNDDTIAEPSLPANLRHNNESAGSYARYSRSSSASDEFGLVHPRSVPQRPVSRSTTLQSELPTHRPLTLAHREESRHIDDDRIPPAQAKDDSALQSSLSATLGLGNNSVVPHVRGLRSSSIRNENDSGPPGFRATRPPSKAVSLSFQDEGELETSSSPSSRPDLNSDGYPFNSVDPDARILRPSSVQDGLAPNPEEQGPYGLMDESISVPDARLLHLSSNEDEMSNPLFIGSDHQTARVSDSRQPIFLSQDSTFKTMARDPPLHVKSFLKHEDGVPQLLDSDCAITSPLPADLDPGTGLSIPTDLSTRESRFSSILDEYHLEASRSRFLRSDFLSEHPEDVLLTLPLLPSPKAYSSTGEGVCMNSPRVHRLEVSSLVLKGQLAQRT